MNDKDLLLPFGPSTAEVLQAAHPEWLIWREIAEGVHGDWCARPAEASDDEARLRHRDLDGLRALLEAADG
ncbi:hypothetical protein AB0395_32540 [Streptosporangium sp. NPDC051023]|uniref:hypothetical protein n=1 Tax=Streptosporangium sp. NPDC051023 TaxID=3155410 RepID=UPI00344C7A75